MTYPFKNLVFEGGGVKGIGFVGALQVLEEKQILANIRRFGGTSAGAITALILGLGYTVSELKDRLSVLDLRNFKDDTIGPIRDIVRLSHHYGWYKGDSFENWIKDIIEEKTGSRDSTFRDIYDRMKSHNFSEIYFQGTNISTYLVETFSYENTPNMSIAKAVRISMSIPFFFEAVKLNGNVYVDGGLLDNYPIRLFDWQRYLLQEGNCFLPEYYKETNNALLEHGSNDTRVYNKETLGLRLESKEDINTYMHNTSPKIHQISDFSEFTFHLTRTIMKSQRNMHLNENDSARTIYIDSLGVSSVDFDISQEKKEELIESGKKCTEDYFYHIDHPDRTR